MSRSTRSLFFLLLLLPAALAVAAGGTTKDYTWLLFLKVNEPPVVDAGMDQTISWASYSVFLDATVTDDPRDTLIYTWSNLTPAVGAVTFAPANAEDTTATFSAAGTYVLQLDVSDGKLSSASTVAITLSNSAPTVNAGADQNFDYPQLSTFLNATASDHPMDTLTYTWSKVNGPGSVNFNAQFAQDTQVAFSLSGIYTLRLGVSDGDLTSADSVKVTIVNNPPVVNIFRDLIETESPSVDLAPEVTDSTSAVLTYQWSKVSGPGTVTFSSPQAVSTTATLGLPGSYVLKLTASDGELSGSDTVTVEYVSQPVDKIDVIVAVGDSITVGFGDKDCVYRDAQQCSGWSGIGTTPPPPPNRLEALLAGAPGYDASLIIRERGVGGTTSAYGLSVIDGIISDHPYADMYLVMYGTNDAQPDPPPSKASFKDNMRQIVEKINNARNENNERMIPVLAKAPYAKGDESYRNVAIQLYNEAVQELYAEKSYITISPPDFYTYFKNNQNQIWTYYMFNDEAGINVTDNLHPNSAGYDAMANIWYNRLK
jgi:lysophospholipase L1-like esterase